MQINLLPWREQERKYKKIRFAIILASEFVLTLLIILILYMYYHILIQNQLNRNKYLETVINYKKDTAAKYKKEEQRLVLISNDLNFIISLRENNYDVVRELDEIIRVVPEGVTFLSINRVGNHITINGRSQSDLQVTQFMESIAKSKLFQQPVLTSIASHSTPLGEERHFQVVVDQKEYLP